MYPQLNYYFQKSFDNLTHLDLFNNDICNMDDYRTKVFKLLPNLKYLDDADADDNEAEEESDAEDEGEDGDAEANGAEEEDDDGKFTIFFCQIGHCTYSAKSCRNLLSNDWFLLLNHVGWWKNYLCRIER